jgi:hypothetical protein
MSDTDGGKKIRKRYTIFCYGSAKERVEWRFVFTIPLTSLKTWMRCPG